MAPNNNMLAIHKYNTKYGQHCVVCFRLNLAMKWLVEFTKNGLCILFDFIGVAQG